MALIERDGRVYARKLWIFLGPREWGNDLMRQVAMEALATDPRRAFTVDQAPGDLADLLTRGLDRLTGGDDRA